VSHGLEAPGASWSFAGEEPVTAGLRAGPIRDLNVMTRRGRCQHHVERVEGETLVAPKDVTLVVALGEARLGDIRLGFGDTVQLEGSAVAPLIGAALVIRLQPLASLP